MAEAYRSTPRRWKVNWSEEIVAKVFDTPRYNLWGY